MKVTLPEFERAGVMVVGDVMLDRYWYGPTSRISPEAPVPVVKVNTIDKKKTYSLPVLWTDIYAPPTASGGPRPEPF